MYSWTRNPLLAFSILATICFPRWRPIWPPKRLRQVLAYISVTVNNTNLMLLPILTEIWSKNRLVTFLILKELPFQDGDQYGRQIGKNINISNQKQTKILKFYYINLLTSFHNAMKYGTTLKRSLSTLRCLRHGYSI